MGRVLNPTVAATVIAAGVAYAGFLWSLRIYPHVRLWATAVLPGALFLAVIWAIRAVQGVASALYIALLVEWLIFSVTAVLVVLVTRRWRRLRQ